MFRDGKFISELPEDGIDTPEAVIIEEAAEADLRITGEREGGT